MNNKWNVTDPIISRYALCQVADLDEYRVMYFDSNTGEWDFLHKLGEAPEGYVLKWKPLEDCL